MGKTWADRWNRIKPELTLADLCLDVSGKFLFGIGLGAFLAPLLKSLAWAFIAVGVALSVAVKAKYWRRFWS